MVQKNTIFALMLVFLPFSILANNLGWEPTFIFISAALAIVPLAAFMGVATEEIAVVIGPNLGGLLNATFGNATELILAVIALKEGFVGVVKATITGSIIGNLLLVTGFAMLLGGIRFKEQKFQPIAARLNASAMNLAVIAILLPTAVDITSIGLAETTLQHLSVAVAIVLITVYGLTLLFSMKTHAYLYDVGMVGSRGGFRRIYQYRRRGEKALFAILVLDWNIAVGDIRCGHRIGVIGRFPRSSDRGIGV